MNVDRFQALVGRFPQLRIALVGDFFLDRYFHIDPALAEISIETGLPVYNVVKVRSQPGAAGTVLNNLVALGAGRVHAVGFCGEDGEGYELRQALQKNPGVELDRFITAHDRHTPVYGKPLVVTQTEAPRELNRLDIKNWSPTPEPLQRQIAEHVLALAGQVDAFIVLEQVDQEHTGVITPPVLAALAQVQQQYPKAVIIADSRRGLSHFPPVTLKMNGHELAHMHGYGSTSLEVSKTHAEELANRNGHPVFVTLAEHGILGAYPGEPACHVPAFPVRGPIDVVGAGDSVTATLACVLAAGASLQEAMEMAMAASSIVVHELGTTGTASPAEMADLLGVAPSRA